MKKIINKPLASKVCRLLCPTLSTLESQGLFIFMDMRIVLTDQVDDEKECSFELVTHEENVKSIQLELYLERDLEFAISFDLEELEKAIKILKEKK